MEEEKARKLIEECQTLQTKYEKDGIAIPTMGLGKELSGAKALADLRLKAELDKLNESEKAASQEATEEK